MRAPKQSILAHRLAKRVARSVREPDPVRFQSVPVETGILDELRRHLAAGETHYTPRPGIPELRMAIGQAIHANGGPYRDPDGVIVTHGEGEALYVTLLGLGLNAGTSLIIAGACRHRRLLDILGIVVLGTDDPRTLGARAKYSEVGTGSADARNDNADGRIHILALGDSLFSRAAEPPKLSALPASAILIGGLDSIPGLDHFRLGYVAGPPQTVKLIQTWKQALSICSAGPSQRAALFAIERERVS